MAKTIIIKRRPNTTNLPDHIYAASKRRIGSSFTASGDINTGLDLDEINKYMPPILGIAATDNSFYKQVKKWFMDLSVDIPTEGLELDITTNDKGTPINIMDYIKYKFVIQHPYVLVDPRNEEEKRKKRKYLYTVEDTAREKQVKVEANKLRREALKEYIKVAADSKKTDMVLTVLGEGISTYDEDDKILALEEIAKKTPKTFIDVVTNKNLEKTYFIRECLSNEVLRKVGNSILDGEEVLGNTEEEAVLFLNDKANSEVLVTLKARLKQFKS